MDFPTIVIGALTGLAYAILAAGLVLLYRATRVINFAYGELGAFGAAVLAKLVLDVDWNFFLALALVIVIAAGIGAVLELTIIRRLFEAPRLILLVATIGMSQVLFFAQAVLPGIDNISRYPSPLDVSLRIGSLTLRSEHFMVLAIVPVFIVVLTLFLNRTRHGVVIRAAAENADAARLAGISVRRVSTTVWVLSGVMATVTAVLVNPLRGVIPGSDFSAALGPGLMLRALTAALIGGMSSIPLALVGGVGIGIVEALLFLNVGDPGVADLALFLAVLVFVLVRRQQLGLTGETGLSLAGRVRQVPDRLREVWWVRHLPKLGGTAAVIVAVLLSVAFTDSARLFLFTRVALYAIVALSLTVLTGWAGQLSLGQYAFVGLGSFATAALQLRGMPFGIAVFFGVVAGVSVALLIGAPALRISGLFLAVTTLGFAVMGRTWLFTRPALLGDNTAANVDRGVLWFLDLRAPRTYYLVCLAVLVLVVLAVSRLRHSGVGRSMIAVRDNEQGAAAFTVSPAMTKLAAFAVAGGLAALAGGLLAGARVQFAALNFGPEESLRVVSMAIIGGLGSIAGSVLGAVYVLGLPALIQDSPEVRLLTSGVGLLILLLYFPGGLAQLLYRARDALLDLAARRVPWSPPPQQRATAATIGADEPADTPDVVLRATDVTVRFGGRTALESVTFELPAAKIVGLIGANGAGKSTLVGAMAGSVRIGEGRIELLGSDVTDRPAHERARMGLGRVFQDARLFGDLTVRESVKLALEARERSELVPSMLGLPPALRAERRKAREAAELVAFLGLGRYADAFVSDLSTGTRRITELACLAALRPRVILLDEPTAGVAQREAEAFGPLIESIATELDASLVLIEHDIPLVMSISDRVYCLEAGSVISQGTPQKVRNDPRVIVAYLGTDERAIRRSDARGRRRTPAKV